MVRFFQFIILLTAFSCGVESSEIGADFLPGGSIELSYIDSSTLILSTTKFDSMISNNKDRIMAGSYEDSRLGRTTSIPYIQFSIPTTTVDANIEVSFDHLTLTLKYDTYSYGDTTKQLTLNVHRLNDEIYTDDGGFIYNTSKVGYDENALGTFTFFPRPHRDDSVEIKLSNEFGEKFWSKLIDSDEDFVSETEFLEYFKGIAVVPDSSNGAAIVGFTNAPELRLYYLDKSAVPSVQKYISFPVTSNKLYSWIHSNKTATNLSELQASGARVEAINSDNESYLQAGTGLALRVDMPYLRSLTQYENFHVSKAFLDLYPVRKSYSENEPLPDQLFVYKVDKRNSQYGTFEVNALLYIDDDLERDTHYQFDATDFVKEQLALEEFNENALLFITEEENYTSTVDRLYMAAPGYEYKTQLRIYFVTLNQ